MAKQHKCFGISSSLVVGALIGSTAWVGCEEKVSNKVKPKEERTKTEDTPKSTKSLGDK